MNIWWVESGCYSDYTVHGVFSSKANAERWILAENGGHECRDYGVVESTLDDFSEVPIRMAKVAAGKKAWRVTVSVTGEVKVWASTYPMESDDYMKVITHYGDVGLTEGMIWSADEEGAKRIASDVWSQMRLSKQEGWKA